MGAYSYSEGIESLVETGAIASEVTLRNWLQDSLQFGAIRVEAAVAVRALRAAKIGDLTALSYWNSWATATKETEELRSQSWQMGRTLLRLLLDLRSSSRASLTPAPTPSMTIVQEFVESDWRSMQFCDRLWHCRCLLAD